MKQIFYIFRHGQTDYNVENRIQSSLDIPLNQTGITQAHNLAKNLAPIQFDCVYSSPLSRALDTAKIVAENRDIKIMLADGLQERSLGILCGKKINITHDSADTPVRTDEDVVSIPLALLSNNDYAPENGESYNMFAKRVRETMIKIAQNTDAQTIGISTHGGVLGAIIRQFTDFAHGGAPNTAYMKMLWDGNTFTLLETPDWLLRANTPTQTRY